MEAPARQVLGGKHINCRGPRTEPWGTSFHRATEMQFLHRQKMHQLLSLDLLCEEHASVYTTPRV